MESLCDDIMFFIVSLLSDDDKISFGQSKQCFASYIISLDDDFVYPTGGIDKFTNLMSLNIDLYDIPFTQNINKLTNLTNLEICAEVEDLKKYSWLGSIDCLIRLRSLALNPMPWLNCKSIIPINKLTNLTSLVIENIEIFDSMKSLTSLKYLYITSNEILKLENLPISITSLNFEWCYDNNKLSNLENLTNLTELTFNGEETPPLKTLTNLKKLDIYDAVNPDSLPPNIVSLSCQSDYDNNKLSNLENLTDLADLTFSGRAIPSLRVLTNLKKLIISNKCNSVLFVSKLTNLTYLDLGRTSSHDVVGPDNIFRILPNLTYLSTSDILLH
jgi:hypothetical protein